MGGGTLLAGRRALVTGAGRGIGTPIALYLAAEGCAVCLAYRGSAEGAEKAAAAIRARGGTAATAQGDLTQAADAEKVVREATEALGGLDILVNNAAGFGPKKELAVAPWEHLDREWRAVVQPTVLVTRAALGYFARHKYGRIVNLAATLVDRPAIGFGAHAMAKAAILAYTRTLAREVGPDNITVNAVSPGMTLTEFSQSLPEDVKESVRQQTPLRRLAAPDDVARAVVFFASPLADFITGANLAADGGLAVL